MLFFSSAVSLTDVSSFVIASHLQLTFPKSCKVARRSAIGCPRHFRGLLALVFCLCVQRLSLGAENVLVGKFWAPFPSPHPVLSGLDAWSKQQHQKKTPSVCGKRI